MKHIILIGILMVFLLGCEEEQPPRFRECEHESDEIEVYDLIDYYNYSCPKIKEIIEVEYVPYNMKMSLWNITYLDKEKCGQYWISTEYWNLPRIRKYYFEECLQ